MFSALRLSIISISVLISTWKTNGVLLRNRQIHGEFTVIPKCFVCVPQTDTSSSYLAVDSTHTAVGRFWSLVRRPGTRCLTISEIRRVVLTVLSSFLRQSCLVVTNVTSALEVFLNIMRYINPRFTLLCFTLLGLRILTINFAVNY